MNCITIQHCIVRQWASEKAVSRYNYCIVTEEKRGRWALGARGARRRACVGSRVGAAGSWARARGAAGGRACGAGGGRRAGRSAGGAQALDSRSARSLGTRAGYGLCTRCTRPVFDLV